MAGSENLTPKLSWDKKPPRRPARRPVDEGRGEVKRQTREIKNKNN
jgi:hypothetical protein